ncbi:hypothetical protein F5I97DRAFT_1974491 [Phlebopus sp. FC_14]|nr:hypothetical protein F5I97DRAFT_1974491 [Phlebopus sp. FC_14]
MSRLPPSLLYLTVYNPALRPSSPTNDDEDAEEQAQILFYTSRDRAVSRDKMLRQVGLAKALVNFAEIFHSTIPYQNVHSQSKRMIMLNPEPDFWIHAAIELANTPRSPPKSKGKSKGKGKAKEADNQEQQSLPEYHDGSLHDTAVRAHLWRGYEQFKLTHGSFTFILSSLGQQALELQLERFFTVWAWTWDLERGTDLSLDLGLPLHPSYHALLPSIDTFSSHIPDEMVTLVLTPDSVAPSSRYRSMHLPTALARYLLTLLPPARDTSSASASTIKIELAADAGEMVNSPRGELSKAEEHTSNGFLGIPPVHFGMAMDIRKWSWSGALPFGKISGAKQKFITPASQDGAPGSRAENHVTQVDHSALEDAISSGNPYSLAEKSAAPDDMDHFSGDSQHEKQLTWRAVRKDDAETPRPSRIPSPAISQAESSAHPRSTVEVDPAPSNSALHFAPVTVFLANDSDPLATYRRKVSFLQRNNLAVALLGLGNENSSPEVDLLQQSAIRLLEEIERVIVTDVSRSLESSLPSATNILQSKDCHIMTTGQYTTASVEPFPASDIVYDARQLLEREAAVVEVFSRGLNPQHWHVARRAVDHTEDGKGEVYVQVSRKEASLSDVENVLQRLYRS